MLYITGEYIEIRPPRPEVSTGKRLLSFLVPVKITSDSFGADYIRRLYFKHTYRLWLGRLSNEVKELVRTEEYE